MGNQLTSVLIFFNYFLYYNTTKYCEIYQYNFSKHDNRKNKLVGI